MVLLLIALAALLFHGHQVRKRAWRERRFERSGLHQAQVAALTDWLQNEKLCRAFVRFRAAKPQGLQALFDDLEDMTAAEVQATIGLLLANRDVRRLVADHVEQTQKIPRAEALRCLLEWAMPAKQAMAS